MEAFILAMGWRSPGMTPSARIPSLFRPYTRPSLIVRRATRPSTCLSPIEKQNRHKNEEKQIKL